MQILCELHRLQNVNQDSDHPRCTKRCRLPASAEFCCWSTCAGLPLCCIHVHLHAAVKFASISRKQQRVFRQQAILAQLPAFRSVRSLHWLLLASYPMTKVSQLSRLGCCHHDRADAGLIYIYNSLEEKDKRHCVIISLIQMEDI